MVPKLNLTRSLTSCAGRHLHTSASRAVGDLKVVDERTVLVVNLDEPFAAACLCVLAAFQFVDQAHGLLLRLDALRTGDHLTDAPFDVRRDGR